MFKVEPFRTQGLCNEILTDTDSDVKEQLRSPFKRVSGEDIFNVHTPIQLSHYHRLSYVEVSMNGSERYRLFSSGGFVRFLNIENVETPQEAISKYFILLLL